MQRGAEVTRVIRSLFFFITALLADQATKLFARTYPNAWQGTFFRFTENQDMVFSISVPDIMRWALIVVAVIFLSVLLFDAIWRKRPERITPLLFVVAGGTSNIIDRIRFGAVTDIFVFPGGLFFNIADCMIIIGILSFLWHNRFSPRPS